MSNESVKSIQQALNEKGFNPGKIDGIWGRNTIVAVKAFQKSVGLNDDGVVGPKTAAALFNQISSASVEVGSSTNPSIIPWFEEAKHLIGTKEISGYTNNPVIMEWADDLDIQYSNDDVPWCGLFVAHCVGSTLANEVLPANPLGARQWEKFGTSSIPRIGAVMVFLREYPKCGKGHVGFYAGEDATAYQILGGNQSNKVCLTWVSKSRLVGVRWPKTASMLVSQAVQKGRTDGLSQDEA